MTKAGLSGLLVTHLPDLRYLCGFTGSSAALAVTRRHARLFTDGRYTTQAAEEVRGASVGIVTGPPAVAGLEWLRTSLASRLRPLTRARPPWPNSTAGGPRCLLACEEAFCGNLPEPLVQPLRMVKDEDELAAHLRGSTG